MSTFTFDAVAHKIEQSMWHKIDETARTNTTVARLYSIPAAIETFAKDVLYVPACFIESALTSALFLGKVLTFQTSGTIRHWMWIDTKTLWYHSLTCSWFIPISPFYATIDSIKTLWSVAMSPAKAGKIEATRVELNKFVYTLLTTAEISTKDTIYCIFLSKNPPRLPSPSCVGIGNFVLGAFGRFKETVAAAKSDAEIANLHFIDTDEAKQQLIAEVVAKCEKIKDAHEHGYLGERLKVVQDKNASEQEKEIVYEELNRMWLEFQQIVVRARPEELGSLKFEPQAETLLRRGEGDF